MTFIRLAFACAAPIALGLTALAAPVQAQTSPAFERAILGELDAPTRAYVQKRAAGGNSVSEVIGTILLNKYHAIGPKHPGEALKVFALDFARGTCVLGYDRRTLEILHFDRKT